MIDDMKNQPREPVHKIFPATRLFSDTIFKYFGVHELLAISSQQSAPKILLTAGN